MEPSGIFQVEFRRRREEQSTCDLGQRVLETGRGHRAALAMGTPGECGVAEPARPSRGMGPGGRACSCPHSQPSCPKPQLDAAPRCRERPTTSAWEHVENLAGPGTKPGSRVIGPGCSDKPESQARGRTSGLHSLRGLLLDAAGWRGGWGPLCPLVRPPARDTAGVRRGRGLPLPPRGDVTSARTREAGITSEGGKGWWAPG